MVMNTYVLPATLALSGDTFGAFVASMFYVPESLKPKALIKSLSRSRPSLGS
jgi:hypothetical protein